MAIDTIDSLLSILRRVQLLASEQVDEIAQELVPFYSDPVALGEYLVQIDWLTPYQLQLLLAGQWRELTLGPYHILDCLGEGGVSEVFKAWDTLHGRIVALKVLRQDLTGQDDAVQQFQREFQAINQLSHPNIIRTFDAHNNGGLHFFAMEFVEGMDLERFVQQVGPLAIELACDYARQAAQGLQHAHQSGLVHRDIKPANLFLLHPPLPLPPGTPPRKLLDPVVKIIDWGLARCSRELTEGNTPLEAAINAEKGALVGTADYIAPEQARDPTLVDIRADIYSLGCTLYFLLTGQPPFPAPTWMQKVMMHQEAEPPSLQDLRPDVPRELEELVRKMMAKNPADRFQIPLLVVTPLRRYCAAGPGVTCGLRPVTVNGLGYRPGSSPTLNPPSSGMLQRPGSSGTQSRPAAPGTALNLPRPATQTALHRPGFNGTNGRGNHPK